MPEIQSPAPVRNVDAPERVWKAGEHERAILGQRLLDQSMHQTYEIFARSFAAEWNNGSNERGKRKKKKPDTGPRLINSISEIAHIPECGYPPHLADFKNVIERNIIREVDRAIESTFGAFPHDVENLLLHGLPPDLPCSPLIEIYTVGDRDPRVALRGQEGVRVRLNAKGPLRKGSFVGVYRGNTIFHRKYSNKFIFAHPENMAPFDYEILVESYTANTECDDLLNWATDHKVTFPDKHLKDPNCLKIMVSAAKYGNLTCVINDPHLDPLGESDASLGANVCMVEIVIGTWPFLVMATMEDIAPAQELRYSYGLGFWDNLNGVIRRRDVNLREAAKTGTGNGTGNGLTARASGMNAAGTSVHAADEVSGDAWPSQPAAAPAVGDPTGDGGATIAATEVQDGSESVEGSTPAMPAARIAGAPDVNQLPQVTPGTTPGSQRFRIYSRKTPQGKMRTLGGGFVTPPPRFPASQSRGGAEGRTAVGDRLGTTSGDAAERPLSQPDFGAAASGSIELSFGGGAGCSGGGEMEYAAAAPPASGEEEEEEAEVTGSGVGQKGEDQNDALEALEEAVNEAQRAFEVAERQLESKAPMVSHWQELVDRLRPPPPAAPPAPPPPPDWAKAIIFGFFRDDDDLKGPYKATRLAKMLGGTHGLDKEHEIFIYPGVLENNPGEEGVAQEVVETIPHGVDGVWRLEQILEAAHLLLPTPPNPAEGGITGKKRGRPSKAEQELAEELAAAEEGLAKALAVQEDRRRNLEERKKVLETAQERLRQAQEERRQQEEEEQAQQTSEQDDDRQDGETESEESEDEEIKAARARALEKYLGKRPAEEEIPRSKPAAKSPKVTSPVKIIVGVDGAGTSAAHAVLALQEAAAEHGSPVVEEEDNDIIDLTLD